MFYDVTKYGIVGDGITNNTEKINALTKSMTNGGTLYFPSGEYVTGTIRLYSNITMHLDSGAKILGSNDIKDFPKISNEDAPGYTRGGYEALISAFNAENITVSGNGIIDARGEFWWKNEKSDLIRPRTISFFLSKNIKIKDVTIMNSPCWTVHPVCCSNVLIDGVSIKNPYDSPNTDGINPESCSGVRISNCFVDVGDDCVTIKSGTEDDDLQKQYPCENIVISNCVMAHGHGGVVIGSEMSGGVKNLSVSNCVFQNTDRGIRVKTRRNRGGYIKGMILSNIIMENVISAIVFNEFYDCGIIHNPEETLSAENQEINELTPIITDININGIIARGVKGAGIYMYGIPELPISNIIMNDINIDVPGTEGGTYILCAPRRDISMGEGIFLENTENIFMNNININSKGEKYVIKDCKNIVINGKKES